MTETPRTWVHHRSARQRRLADPVERVGLRSWLVEPTTGINLHNLGLGFSLEAGHPSRTTARPSTAAHAVPVDGDEPGWFAARRLRHDGRRRPAADRPPGRSSAVRPPPVPAVAINSGRWALRGPVTGFDTWTAPQCPQGPGGGQRSPADWAAALEAKGHTVVRSPPSTAASDSTRHRPRRRRVLVGRRGSAHVGSVAGR